VIGGLIVVALLIVGITLFVNRESILFRWRLEQLTESESLYLEREIEDREDAEHDDEVAAAESWIIDRGVASRRDLERVLRAGSRREKIVALHLLWKLDGSPETVDDLEPLWTAFAPARVVDRLLARLPRHLVVHRASVGLHETFIGEGLLVLLEPDTTTVWRTGVYRTQSSAEQLALAAARRRRTDRKEGAIATVERWKLSGSERQAHARLLVRAAVLPAFPEVLDEYGRNSSRGRFLRISVEGGPSGQITWSNWPWCARVAEELRDVFQNVPARGDPVSPSEAVDVLVKTLQLAPDSPSVVHAVLAVADRADAQLSAEALRSRLDQIPATLDTESSTPRSRLWLAAARHVFGDSEPLVVLLDDSFADWPPLEDPRLGSLLSRRPRGVLPALLLRLITLEDETLDVFTLQLCGMSVDVFEATERKALEKALRLMSEVRVTAFLVGALEQVETALGDIAYGCLARLGKNERTSYLETLALTTGRRDAASWETLFGELTRLDEKGRIRRFRDLPRRRN
jgi:hypothetical protein